MTTDHISPAGAFKNGHAGRGSPGVHGVQKPDFNSLRRAAATTT